MKVIIVGHSKVGKSCILDRLTDDIFTEDQKPTIGDEYGTCYYRDGHIKFQLCGYCRRREIQINN